jgi:hypothetical protein
VFFLGYRIKLSAINVLQNSYYLMKHSQLRYIHGLKTGDKGIFGELFSEYYEPLCRWCSKYVADPQEAEEIVQDTFVNLWEKRSDLQIGVSLNAYLYRAVANRALRLAVCSFGLWLWVGFVRVPCIGLSGGGCVSVGVGLSVCLACGRSVSPGKPVRWRRT